MKYNVDQDLCIGCGMCESLKPEVFKMNDEGKAEAYGEGEAQEAVESCPAAAISPQEGEEKAVGGKYVCPICGYVYDPEKGDPENGIHAGTAFENLPDDWACPLCGLGKEVFEPINE